MLTWSRGTEGWTARTDVAREGQSSRAEQARDAARGWCGQGREIIHDSTVEGHRGGDGHARIQHS